MLVYVLQAMGLGDAEDAFYNVGAYATRELAEQAERDLLEELAQDELGDTLTQIETLTLVTE